MPEKEYIVRVVANLSVEKTVFADSEEKARKQAETEFYECLDVMDSEVVTVVGTEIIGRKKDPFLHD